MKELGLAITLQFGFKTVHFLDTTLNLNTSEYNPFRKPNEPPSNIQVHSNHSLNTRQLPKMANSRISSISSNEQVFREAHPFLSGT